MFFIIGNKSVAHLKPFQRCKKCFQTNRNVHMNSRPFANMRWNMLPHKCTISPPLLVSLVIILLGQAPTHSRPVRKSKYSIAGYHSHYFCIDVLFKKTQPRCDSDLRDDVWQGAKLPRALSWQIRAIGFRGIRKTCFPYMSLYELFFMAPLFPAQFATLLFTTVEPVTEPLFCRLALYEYKHEKCSWHIESEWDFFIERSESVCPNYLMLLFSVNLLFPWLLNSRTACEEWLFDTLNGFLHTLTLSYERCYRLCWQHLSVYYIHTSESRVQACYILLFSHLIQSAAKCFPFKNVSRLADMGMYLNLLCVCLVLKRLYSTKKWSPALVKNSHKHKKKVASSSSMECRDTPFVRKKRKLIRIHPLGPWDIIAKTQ